MSSKGFGAFAIMFILLVVAMVTIYLFFQFFKFHIALTAIQSYNFIRYDNIPLTFYNLIVSDLNGNNKDVQIPIIFALNKDYFFGDVKCSPSSCTGGIVKDSNGNTLYNQLKALYETSKILAQCYALADPGGGYGGIRTQPINSCSDAKAFCLQNSGSCNPFSSNFFNLKYPIPLVYNPTSLLSTLSYRFQNQ